MGRSTSTELSVHESGFGGGRPASRSSAFTAASRSASAPAFPALVSISSSSAQRIGLFSGRWPPMTAIVSASRNERTERAARRPEKAQPACGETAEAAWRSFPLSAHSFTTAEISSRPRGYQPAGSIGLRTECVTVIGSSPLPDPSILHTGKERSGLRKKQARRSRNRPINREIRKVIWERHFVFSSPRPPS